MAFKSRTKSKVEKNSTPLKSPHSDDSDDESTNDGELENDAGNVEKELENVNELLSRLAVGPQEKNVAVCTPTTTSSTTTGKPTTTRSKIASEIVCFAGWKTIASKTLLKPSLMTRCGIDDLLANNNLNLNVKAKEIPRIKYPLRNPMYIKSFNGKSHPEPKPNLLTIILSLLSNSTTPRPKISKADMVSTFNQFDIIMPRNPLKKVMSLPAEFWELYVYRPSADLPVFVDRVQVYAPNRGTIGNQFEKQMTFLDKRQEKYHKIYSISRTMLDDVCLCLTGEIDAVDEKGVPVEIKSRPAWAAPDSDRAINTWIQSRLSGVEKIVTGSFQSKQNTVRFTPHNIVQQSIDEFERDQIAPKDLEDTIEYGASVLKEIQTKCNKIETLYLVSGKRGNDIRIQEKSSSDYEFPISKEMLDLCIESIGQKA